MKQYQSILLFCLLLLNSTVFSQYNETDAVIKRPQNSISVGFGDASLISLSYERLFIIHDNLFLAARLGIGYNEEFQLCLFGPCENPPKTFTTFPHSVTVNFGKNKHLFELGLGGAVIEGNTSDPYLLYPIIGYRLQPLKAEKVNLRLYLALPISSIETEDFLFIPAGLSVGIIF